MNGGLTICLPACCLPARSISAAVMRGSNDLELVSREHVVPILQFLKKQS